MRRLTLLKCRRCCSLFSRLLLFPSVGQLSRFPLIYVSFVSPLRLSFWPAPGNMCWVLRRGHAATPVQPVFERRQGEDTRVPPWSLTWSDIKIQHELTNDSNETDLSGLTETELEYDNRCAVNGMWLERNECTLLHFIKHNGLRLNKCINVTAKHNWISKCSKYAQNYISGVRY